MNELKEISQHVVEVARSAGADDVVAEAIATEVKQVRFSNSQVDAVNSWSEEHLALLVAIGKKVMSSDIRTLRDLDPHARALVSLAKKVPPSKTYEGVASGRFKYRRDQVDGRIVKLRDPSRFVHEAIAGAEGFGADNVGGTFYAIHERVGLASSGGAVGADESTAADLSVRAFSQPEASGHAVCCTPTLAGMEAKKTGERAGEFASHARDPVMGEQGKFDLIVDPLFLGSFVNSTSGMLSAMRVEISNSMFEKKIGKRVASDEVTFLDDPTIRSTTRRAFDHEGVPTRRNVLIKDGVLKTYLHNTGTAKRFKTRTTANAGPLIPNPYGSAAQPIAFHPVVVPGDWKRDELIADTKRGLYINNTWYTRYQNYSTGEFSTIPRDAILRVENGEIVGAVKNIRISDNMMNFWKSIDALSREAQEIYWWEEAAPPSTLPTVRARQITITRSA
jgi:PmbA protein